MRASRFAFLFAGFFGLLAAVDTARAAEQWFYGHSPHFELISSASEKKSRTMLVHLERFRENVLAMFPARAMQEPRVTVVLFGSQSGFNPYRPRYNGQIKEVSGYFINDPDEVFIGMCTDYSSDDGNDPEEIIFHEYLHLLVESRGLRLPLWLNEGLAEVFSTFEVNDKFVEYGRPKQIYVDMMSFSAFMPLKRLLMVDHRSPDYNEESRASTFYAESWLLTHYLLCGKDRSNQVRLVKFLERTGGWVGDPTGAFKEIFGKDVGEMELALRGYLSGGEFFQQRMPVQPIDPTSIVIRASTPVERDVALLKLRWRLHRSPQDVPPLFALVESAPKEPGPHEALASVFMTQGNRESAMEHWRKAAELSSRNAFVYVRVAQDTLSRFDAAEFDERLSPQEAFHLQLWLDRALILRPGYPEAIETLATVESRAPSLRGPGINSVQQGVPLLTDRSSTLLSIAVIRWRANDPKTASEIVDVLIESSRTPPKIKLAATQLRARLTADAKSQPAAASTPPNP